MKAAYLVLDMQVDLVGEAGANANSPLGAQVRARDIVARTTRAIARARAAGMAAGLFQLGRPGCEIDPRLGRQESDWLVADSGQLAFAA